MAARTVLRVLLAMDGARPNDDVLRAVWSLLEPEQLELTGLYVEDEDLLRAAGLPCLREISRSGTESALDSTRLALDMATEVATARRAFDALAQRLIQEHGRFGHHFTVARGRINEVFDRAAADSDFVMVTRAHGGAGPRRRLGRSIVRLAQQPKHVLFVNEPWASGSSVAVLHDNGPGLRSAARLAAAQELRLVIVMPVAATPPTATNLPANTTVRQLVRWEEEAIAELCLREDARLLVLPPFPDIDWAELLVSLVDRLPCSLLKLAPTPRAPGR